MSDWHADAALLQTYAHGRADAALSFSVEAHLIRCARCRAGLSDSVERASLERIWGGVVAEIHAPRRGPIEALMVRAGIPEYVARLIAATPSLRISWIAAVAAALGFAVGAAHAGPGGLLLFLMLAPLLPVAGVAVAYGPGMDPTYEIGLTAPMRSFRLLFLRAAAVLATTTILAAVATLFLPRLSWTAAAWLLPSLGLTLSTLALTTKVSTTLVAAGAVAGVWIALTTVGYAATRDDLAAFRGPFQALFALVAIVSSLVIAARSERFEMRRR
ncbi:MAG: zf-HC2 domain-containing protein [Actinomycetota bacterium]